MFAPNRSEAEVTKPQAENIAVTEQTPRAGDTGQAGQGRPACKDLNEEQRSLLLSARKEPGKYVEGVVLADNLEALFRSVPPPLSLALAMTEKCEKAERAEIMRERDCSELEAVHIVAERVAAQRGGGFDAVTTRIPRQRMKRRIPV